ncbi:hypothetical protein QL285_075913 [Trifolium repens]|nr:hypothetical protein QL285_075913 [Trifolium repens]
MQTITNLNNASEASARSLWIRTHSRHLECDLLLDDRLVHLPDRSQCATYLKKQKKGLSVTWSDEDDSENELENEVTNHVSAMTGVCDFDAESIDEELTYEVLASTYKDLCIRSEELCRTVVEQNAIIDQLKMEKQKL